MTNSVIPYSFVPGTKAKAGEVNANFNAIVDYIDQTKTSINNSIDSLSQQNSATFATKADKTELVTNFNVTETGTDLNSYKTPGTYCFSSSYTPLNIPIGTEGVLLVFGTENNIKQIWLCENPNPMKYTRSFKNNEWSNWFNPVDPSFYRKIVLPNGYKFYWGFSSTKNMTYPVAFTNNCIPLFSKFGCGLNYERSDTGFVDTKLTGFNVNTGGIYDGHCYMVIGI